MAGAQFKQNPREVVKLHCWEMTELLRYSESLRIAFRHSYDDSIFTTYVFAGPSPTACAEYA